MDKSVKIIASQWSNKFRLDHTVYCFLELEDKKYKNVKFELSKQTSKYLNAYIKGSALAITPVDGVKTKNYIQVYAKYNDEIIAKEIIPVEFNKSKKSKLILGLTIGLGVPVIAAATAATTIILTNNKAIPEDPVTITGIPETIPAGGGEYTITVKNEAGDTINVTSVRAECNPTGIVNVSYNTENNKLKIEPIDGKGGKVNITLHITGEDGFHGVQTIEVDVFSEDHNWIVKKDGTAIAIADDLEPSSFCGLLDPGGTSGQDKYLWVKDRDGKTLKIAQYDIKEINIGNTSSSVEQLYTPYGTTDSQGRRWYGFLDDCPYIEYVNLYGFSHLKTIKARYFMYYQPSCKTIDMRNMTSLESFIDTNAFESGNTGNMAFNSLTTLCLPNRTPPTFISETQQCILQTQFFTNKANMIVWCGDHLEEYKTATEWKKLADNGFDMRAGYPEKK